MRLEAFKFTQEGDFSVEQILGALRVHMKKTTQMFKPAHATAILDPEPAKISQTEFIHAKKQWELQGFSPFSKYQDVVKGFEAQEDEGRAPRNDQPLAPQIQGVVNKALGKPDQPLSHEELRKKTRETGKMPWDGMAWGEMASEIRSALWHFCRSLPSDGVRKIYCNTYGINFEVLTAWAENPERNVA